MRIFMTICLAFMLPFHCYSGFGIETNAILVVRFEDHRRNNMGVFLTENEKRDFYALVGLLSSRPPPPKGVISVRFPIALDIFFFWVYDPVDNDMKRHEISFTESGISPNYLIDSNGATDVVKLMNRIKRRMREKY